MNDFTYENLGSNTYLVYTLTENEFLDSTSLGMLTNNEIPGLASTMFMQRNAARYIKYKVSSKIPVSQFFSGQVNRKKLLSVFKGISDAMLSAEEYMIDSRALILDLNYIFVDVATCGTSLICLPVDVNMRTGMEPGMFFRNIMFGTQFDQRENCEYVARIINYLNGAAMFSMENFRGLLEELMEMPSGGSVHPAAEAVMPARKPVEREQVSIRPPQQEFGTMPQEQISWENKGGSGFEKATIEVNPVPERIPVPPVPEVSVYTNQKKMSMLYLLQHYNKENADAYKAQKAARKEKKNSKTPKRKEPTVPVKSGTAGQLAGIMIPGQEMPQKPQGCIPSQSAVESGVRMQVPPVNPGRMEADFGDTVLAGAEEGGNSSETVMMGDVSVKQQIRPHLIRERNNEIIPIQKTLFRLGRNMEFNDYGISGNEYIGNSHCHIIARDGEYFIVDDNSKNHTYVGDAAIPSGTEIKLVHGQKIKLANEEFEFRLF